MIVRRALNSLLFGLLGFSTVAAFCLQDENKSRPVVYVACEAKDSQDSKFVLGIFDQGSAIKGQWMDYPSFVNKQNSLNEDDLELRITRSFKDLRIEIFSKQHPKAELILKDAKPWDQITEQLTSSVMRGVYNSLPHDAIFYSQSKPNEAVKYDCNLRTKI